MFFSWISSLNALSAISRNLRMFFSRKDMSEYMCDTAEGEHPKMCAISFLKVPSNLPPASVTGEYNLTIMRMNTLRWYILSSYPGGRPPLCKMKQS